MADALGLFNAVGVKLVFIPEQNVITKQVKDIVMQYLTAHPETRHDEGAYQTVEALKKAFPCKKQAR